MRSLTVAVCALALLFASAAGASRFFVVRVGLLSMGKNSSAVITSEHAFASFDPASSAQLSNWKAGTSVTVAASGNRVLIGNKGYSSVYFSSEGPTLTLRSKSARSYRGWLHVSSENGSLLVVNEVPLESYLIGVIPCEISASAPMEALKAQAIASRSYVIKKIDGFGSAKYDVDDTVSSQVYLGASFEKPTTNQAVRETANHLLFYQGRVVSAIFGANAGGMTEAAHLVWGGAPRPYLMPILDVDAAGQPYARNSKNFLWSAEFASETIAQAVALAGLGVGNVSEVEVAARTEAGRAMTISVRGSAGAVSMPSAQFRKALGFDKLRSTWFNIVKTESGWRFDGRGWGHGVGFCQDGAVGRAKAGQSHREILSAYFPGTQVGVVRGDPLHLSTRGSVVSRRKFSRG